MDTALPAGLAELTPAPSTIVVVGGEGAADLVRIYPSARINIFYLGRHPLDHYCVDLEIPRIHYLHVGRFSEVIEGAECLLERALIDALWIRSPHQRGMRLLQRHGYTKAGDLFTRPS